MNISFRRAAATCAALGCAAVALLPLTGCQGHKVIARVNGAPINEEEFNERTQRVPLSPSGQMPRDMDAGGFALVAMIQEKLTEQLAAKILNATPTQETVQTYFDYIARSPEIADVLRSGKKDPEELKRQIKLNLEEVGIGTNGDKPADKDVQAMYDELRPKLSLEVWQMRILQTPPDLPTVQRALNELQRTKSFEQAAQLLGEPPQQAMEASKERSILASAMPPDTYEKLKLLKDGQFTPSPIPLMNPQSPGAASGYLIGQMIKKNPKYVPTIKEVRPLLEQAVLAKKEPQWFTHQSGEIEKFAHASSIQINIKRYEPLLNVIRPPQALPIAPPPGSAVVPSAPPSGAQTPTSSGVH